VLRPAKPVFPEIRPWTEDIVDARYDPRTKLLAAIYGERSYAHSGPDAAARPGRR
jgi:hypothetical protein